VHPTGCLMSCRTHWCNLQGASGALTLSGVSYRVSWPSVRKECVLESVAGSVGVTGVSYSVPGGPVRSNRCVLQGARWICSSNMFYLGCLGNGIRKICTCGTYTGLTYYYFYFI